MPHRFHPVQQGFVEIDIDQVGTGLPLLSSHGKRVFEIMIEDQFFKFWRTSHIGALPGHQKTRVTCNPQWLQS